jgi:hypothetical protein
VVEVEHSTKSLPALYSTTVIDRGTRTLQKAMLQPLMITSFVVMLYVMRERAFERRSAEEDHAPGALLLHRAHESRRVCIQIW